MSTKPPSRVVFVGNIPYGLSEEQISEIFSGAGKVLNFRLVYDRETGRPKGFGFAEYPDNDSASSAVRNLNDYEIMGRKLRVDFSNEPGTHNPQEDSNSHGNNMGHGRDNNGGGSYNNGGGNNYNNQPANGANDVSQQNGGALPPLPPGLPLPPNITCNDAISRTLNTLPPSQLLDILTSMKQLATNDPNRANELLNQAPQLAYAVFQALLLMGLVSPEAINSVLEPGTGVLPPIAPPGTGYGGPPPQQAGFPGMTNTPPVAAQSMYAAPPQPIAAPPPLQAPPTPAPAAIDPGQEALIQQVLSLADDVIAQLPEMERQQILALRAQFQGRRN